MKRIFLPLLIILVISCGRNIAPDRKIISVSIAPFKYFIEEIADTVYSVNVMVPAGANPHVYEPYPDQIRKLGKSVAYISDGYLGFEMMWLDRFYEINSSMKRLSLAEGLDLLDSDHHHEDGHEEGFNPHYWVSPLSALRIALSLKNFLVILDPENEKLFEENYKDLCKKINHLDSLARDLTNSGGNRIFLIYHPALGYLARDYGLREVSVESDGKEPSPSRLKELIDLARKENLGVILIQKEYDVKNVRAISEETGAVITTIDPLSDDWYKSTYDIISILKDSFSEKNN